MEKNPAWPPTLPHLLEACTSPLEKELVWAVGSPALMGCQAPGIERHLTAGFFEAARLDLDQWIHDAERTPRVEAEVLGSKAMRLGHRFERLIQWWFHEHPEWTVHAQNEVVQLGKHTAGEIDLLAERNGEWTHFELACKFYLSARRSSQWTSWIGLDPKDSLDQKLTVFQRQIELTQREEVRPWLAERKWQVDAHHIWMKGWFFQHFQDLSHPVLPKSHGINCCVGWWCHLQDWPTIWNTSTAWIALQPAHWMRIRHRKTDVTLLHDADDAKAELAGRRALMVAQAEWVGSEWVETSRGVLVQNEWPD